MTSPEWLEANERRFNPELDIEPIIINLGHLGLVDAMEYDHPNPPEAEQRWAQNPCNFDANER